MKIRFPGIGNFIALFRANIVHGHRNLSTESHGGPAKPPYDGSASALYRRISLARDTMIIPILNQWSRDQQASKGALFSLDEVRMMIKNFTSRKRYAHALQCCRWLSDRCSYGLSSEGIATQTELIMKAHGIEKAEEFFNNEVPQLVKPYGALFNCYANTKSVEKAEALLQTMTSLGVVPWFYIYTSMLKLYHRTGNHAKFNALIHEMEQRRICPDNFTNELCLSEFAAVPDVEGIEKTLQKIESIAEYNLKWSNYYTAAMGYQKAGLLDKALEMLRKSEGLIAVAGERRWQAYAFLITQYAALGKKDDVMRLWESYSKNEKACNACYISVIPSVLKFDDLETAEQIYAQWESQNLSCDIRIPKFLVSAYSRKGLVEKAEFLISKLQSKGIKVSSATWYYMTTGYLKIDQHRNAIEAIKKALITGPLHWLTIKESVIACLKFLKVEGDADVAVEIIELLKGNNIVNVDVYDRLIRYTRDMNMELDSLSGLL